MYMKEEKHKRWKNYVVLVLTLAVALAGSFKYISGYSTVSNNVNGREMPICSVETKEKKVALTFEVAWGDEDIRKILDILKIHGIRGTFFMTGDWVEKYPEIVKEVAAAGHDLANHSKSHKSMVEMDEEQQRAQIMQVHEKVEELTGARMQLFRIPYGNYDSPLIRTIQDCGYYPVQWSVDSLDWKDYGAKYIVDAAMDDKNLKNGAIVRLHCGTKYTAEALEKLINKLEKKGYQIVPVSELIYREGYHMDVTGRQIKDVRKGREDG